MFLFCSLDTHVLKVTLHSTGTFDFSPVMRPCKSEMAAGGGVIGEEGGRERMCVRVCLSV